MKICPTKHKAAIGATAYLTADKTFDACREHLFLAADEFVKHHGLLTVSLPVAASLLVGSAVIFIFRHGEKES